MTSSKAVTIHIARLAHGSADELIHGCAVDLKPIRPIEIDRVSQEESKIAGDGSKI